jgi:hypothetical protein
VSKSKDGSPLLMYSLGYLAKITKQKTNKKAPAGAFYVLQD